jgi:hypothetical protein
MTALKKVNQHDPEDRLERCRRLYRKQQDGLTCRALIYEHMSHEGISESTAWRDWDQVKIWNSEDFSKERDSMVSRLASVRFKIIERAIRKGQLGVAAQLCDSLGRAVGEGLEFVDQENINLNIKIEE